MILALVLIPAIAVSMAASEDGASLTLSDWAPTLLTTLVKVGLFITFMLVIGKRALPLLLTLVARTGSRELFTLSVIAVAMGVAFGAAELFGVSFALGAFFAGMMLKESELSHRVAENALPFQDAFAVLFFVAVGMLFNPSVLIEYPLHVLAVVGIIMLEEIHRCLYDCDRVTLPRKYGACGFGQPCADRGILFYSGHARPDAWIAASRRSQHDFGGRIDFNYA